MVDGSNESLYHANEEFDPNLCTGVPLQKSLEIVDVNPRLEVAPKRYRIRDRDSCKPHRLATNVGIFFHSQLKFNHRAFVYRCLFVSWVTG